MHFPGRVMGCMSGVNRQDLGSWLCCSPSEMRVSGSEIFGVFSNPLFSRQLSTGVSAAQALLSLPCSEQGRPGTVSSHSPC